MTNIAGRFTLLIACLVLIFSAVACSLTDNGDNETTSGANGGLATVVRIIDGDTIDVDINGETQRIRYIGVNTPERDEICYAEATAANRDLVEGKRVRLEKDQSETDRFDRLLRYVYVGDTFVNAALVQSGYAEAVSYPPDTHEFDNFVLLEQQAATGNRGCHPTGIFNDGSFTR
jgi:endonuclease YncB( thermonuclease family)